MHLRPVGNGCRRCPDRIHGHDTDMAGLFGARADSPPVKDGSSAASTDADYPVRRCRVSARQNRSCLSAYSDDIHSRYRSQRLRPCRRSPVCRRSRAVHTPGLPVLNLWYQPRCGRTGHRAPLHFPAPVETDPVSVHQPQNKSRMPRQQARLAR